MGGRPPGGRGAPPVAGAVPAAAARRVVPPSVIPAVEEEGVFMEGEAAGIDGDKTCHPDGEESGSSRDAASENNCETELERVMSRLLQVSDV